MNLTAQHLKNLEAYYRTHAESDEQPQAVKAHYIAAIARLAAMKNPTAEQLEAFIDSELEKARKCQGAPTLADTETRYRPTEEARKFRPGLPGISSDRWVQRPDLPPCNHGEKREWHIDGKARNETGELIEREALPGETGTNYQNQLYCRLTRRFINPNGVTCEVCRQHVLTFAQLKKEKAGDELVQMVQDSEMSQFEALKLAEELEL